MKQSVKNSSKKQARKDIRDIEERLSAVEDAMNYKSSEVLLLTAFMHKHRLIPPDIDFPGMLDSLYEALIERDFEKATAIRVKEMKKDSVVRDLIDASTNGSDHPLNLFNIHSITLVTLLDILIQKGICTEEEYQKLLKKSSNVHEKEIEKRRSDHSKQKAA